MREALLLRDPLDGVLAVFFGVGGGRRRERECEDEGAGEHGDGTCLRDATRGGPIVLSSAVQTTADHAYATVSMRALSQRVVRQIVLFSAGQIRSDHAACTGYIARRCI